MVIVNIENLLVNVGSLARTYTFNTLHAMQTVNKISVAYCFGIITKYHEILYYFLMMINSTLKFHLNQCVCGIQTVRFIHKKFLSDKFLN